MRKPRRCDWRLWIMKQIGRILIIGTFAPFGLFVLCCGLLLLLEPTSTVEAVILVVFGLIFIATSKSMPQLFSDAYQLTMKFVRWLKN